MLVEVVATDAEDASGFVGTEGEPWTKCAGGTARTWLLGVSDRRDLESQLLRVRLARHERTVADKTVLCLSTAAMYDQRMTSGTLIRQARTRAGLSQVQLAERSGKDRAQIARWERDAVTPSLETLRELLHACGFDLDLSLVPYRGPDAQLEARLEKALERTPQERLQTMLRARRR